MQAKERVKAAPRDAGMPWRSLPGYTSGGLLRDTGDRNCSPEHAKRELGGSTSFQYRKTGQCSPRLSASTGMRELLETVSEQAPAAALPEAGTGGTGDTSAHDAWLEVVKKRVQAKLERQMVNSSTNGSEPASPLHWQYRQQRKLVVPKEGVKEACPFTRDDAPPGGRPVQTPSRRRTMSPRGSLTGAGASTRSPSEGQNLDGSFSDMSSAEKVIESRRDYGYLQAQAVEKDPMHGSMDRSYLSMSSLKTSGSHTSFTASTISALDHPVHSIRARPMSAMQRRPVWR